MVVNRNNGGNIIIIGGGLTALCLAYYLQDYDIKIIEARERLGGRIFTQYDAGSTPVEKGATWFNKNHTALTDLLSKLKIEAFEQNFGQHAFYEPFSTSPAQLIELPESDDVSFRVKGGTSIIIKTLSKYIKRENIILGTPVDRIEEKEDEIIVHSQKELFNASIVISTLPPHLLFSLVQISPALPENIKKVAQQTHTWMGDSIKIALRFKTPFWKTKNLSATLFSSVGPVTELYDHSNFEGNAFALKGFLNGSYFSLSKNERLELILHQLKKYFGEKIDTYTDYQEQVWQNEKFTFVNYPNHVFPHQNNGHQVYQQSYLNNKLFIAGAETSANFSGYMEGAVRSAKKISDYIKENRN